MLVLPVVLDDVLLGLDFLGAVGAVLTCAGEELRLSTQLNDPGNPQRESNQDNDKRPPENQQGHSQHGSQQDSDKRTPESNLEDQ